MEAKTASSSSGEEKSKESRSQDCAVKERPLLVHEVMGKLTCNKMWSDVDFVFECKNEEDILIPAHKAILAAASPVFAEMLYPAPEFAKPSAKKQKTQVLITSSDAPSFAELLRCIYTDSCNITDTNALTLYKLALMYGVEKLQLACSSHMSECMNLSSACSFFLQSKHKSAEPFGLPCIRESAEDVFAENHHFQFDAASLLRLLKDDSLAASEYTIFKAVQRYCEHKTASLVGDAKASAFAAMFKTLKEQIRFPLMQPNELLELKNEGHISSHDWVQIYSYFALPPKQRHLITLPYSEACREGQSWIPSSLILNKKGLQIDKMKKIFKSFFSSGGKKSRNFPYRFELLWQGSKVGFSSAAFHKRCDDQGPTLTIIESDNDCIFGGFTTSSWEGPKVKRMDSPRESWTFVMKNHLNQHGMFLPVDANRVEYNELGGPCFGTDISLKNKMDETLNSVNCSTYKKSLDRVSSILTPVSTMYCGKSTFKVKEIEVYKAVLVG